MPSKTVCSRCGKPMYRGRGSLPAGMATCQPCRRIAPAPSTRRNATGLCSHCGAPVDRDRWGAWRMTCSAECARAAVAASIRKAQSLPRPARPCDGCGVVGDYSGRPVCSNCSKARRAEHWNQKCRRRRALKRGGSSEPYTLAEIAARDGHRCGLCRKRVAMTQKAPDPKSPVIDHVVPLALGGDDTKVNVQLAHWLCNSRKGARAVGEQLALFG